MTKSQIKSLVQQKASELGIRRKAGNVADYDRLRKAVYKTEMTMDERSVVNQEAMRWVGLA